MKNVGTLKMAIKANKEENNEYSRKSKGFISFTEISIIPIFPDFSLFFPWLQKYEKKNASEGFRTHSKCLEVQTFFIFSYYLFVHNPFIIFYFIFILHYNLEYF